jgi:hypothetical protein
MNEEKIAIIHRRITRRHNSKECKESFYKHAEVDMCELIAEVEKLHRWGKEAMKIFNNSSVMAHASIRGLCLDWVINHGKKLGLDND